MDDERAMNPSDPGPSAPLAPSEPPSEPPSERPSEPSEAAHGERPSAPTSARASGPREDEPATPSEPPSEPPAEPDAGHDDSIAQAMAMGSRTVSVLRDAGASAASAVQTSVRQGIDTARSGIERASEQIEAENRRWEERKRRTRLPAIGTSEPLADLALRLDRQADFFRELAIDALRPTAVRRVVVGLVVVLALTTAGLALASLWHAFLEEGAIDGLLELVGALVAAATATAIAGAVYEQRRASLARDALARAEHAELELRRVAALLAIAKADRGALVSALRHASLGEPSKDEPARR